MKIAYLAYIVDASSEGGVFKKVLDQITVWTEAGHEVSLFLLTGSSGSIWSGAGSRADSAIMGVRRHNLFRRGRAQVSQVLNWDPDLVYVRYLAYYPALRHLLRRYPVIGEINTDDRKQRAQGPIRERIFDSLTRSRFFGRVSGLTTVTHELSVLARSYDKPVFVSGNGFDFGRADRSPAPRNEQPRLVFLGSARGAWSGVDKLIGLAEAFPAWAIDAVGVADSDVGERRPENLRCLGPLRRDQYAKVLAAADVGIGTLALHRKGMIEASPLKVREYLAAGLPTIIGYRDTDFLDPVPFILELPNSETNIIDNLSEIEEFVRAWMGRRVDRDRVQHLDVRLKETDRLDFFERIMAMTAANEVPGDSTSPDRMI